MTSKNKILLIGAEMFMRLGIRSVSMEDLASELGISKKTLYQDFSSKSEILSGIMDMLHAEDRTLCQDVCNSSQNAVEEMIQICRYVLKRLRGISASTWHDLKKYYPEQWKKNEQFHHVYIYEVIYKNLEKGQAEGLYRKELDPDIISKFYVNKTWIIVDEKVFSLKEYKKDKLYSQYITYHLHGIVTDKGQKILEKFEV